MILDGEFLSGSHFRWNLGWPTPNYAGAFLVTLLALAFVFSGSRWRWVALVGEAGGLFLLAKTYSRGAVVAWGLAWLFGLVASREWRVPAQRAVWAARAGLLAVMLFVVGFEWSHAAKNPASGGAPTTEDGSVVNRLALWRGGLKMIPAAPLTGWGAGESGRAYMNWFQDLDRDEKPITMVNSYLHVGVEHGLPSLAMALCIGAALLLVAWRCVRDDTRLGPRERLGERRTETIKQMGSVAAGASLVAWMAANVFTTLWIEPKLWIVPMVAVLLLGWSASKCPQIRLDSLAAASLAIAVIAVGGLYGAGQWLREGQSTSIVPGANGAVMLATSDSTGAVWHVWPDTTVLGLTPGKEIRRLLKTGPANIRLVVHRAAPLQPREIPAGAEGIMLFGRQVERLGWDLPLGDRKLWLIHPTVLPPALDKLSDQASPIITVVLPQIDETGNGPAWRLWAKENGVRVVESPASGLDIRSAWPEIFLLHLNQPFTKGAKSTKESAALSREPL